MLYRDLLKELLAKKVRKQVLKSKPAKLHCLDFYGVPSSNVQISTDTSTPVTHDDLRTALAAYALSDYSKKLFAMVSSNYSHVDVTRGQWLSPAICALHLAFDGQQALRVGDRIVFNPKAVTIGANGGVYQTISPTTIYVNTTNQWYTVILK